MTTLTYAAVPAAWRAVHRVLRDAVWPTDASAPSGEFVHFAGFGEAGEPQEGVLILGEVDQSTENAEETFKEALHEEIFTIVIMACTLVPGRTQWEALARLEEIVAVADNAIDAVTGSSNRPTELAPFEAHLKRTGNTTWEMRPLANGEGFGAVSFVCIQVYAARNVNGGGAG